MGRSRLLNRNSQDRICLGMVKAMLDQRELRCREWNQRLESAFIDDFKIAYSEATIRIFDIYSCTARILADPPSYGFPSDCGRRGDMITYVDHIHPTSAMHAIFAKDLATFLGGGESHKGRYSERQCIQCSEQRWPKRLILDLL